jgi:cytochrome c oxidase subunit 2
MSGGIVAHAGSTQTPKSVFGSVYEVFLILGTLVGVVVIAYTLYNAVKYRDGNGAAPDDADRPQLGEIPSGGGKGRKLFLSFAISAVIVLSLIAWTYSLLLVVENQPNAQGDALEVQVVGHQFSWEFIYPNGASTTTLRVPVDRRVVLTVTSADVFHNIGIPRFGVKADAIPGQTTETWFIPHETGTYTARCYELCGQLHSEMTADVLVQPPDEFQAWYTSTDGGDAQGDVRADPDAGASETGAATTEAPA